MAAHPKKYINDSDGIEEKKESDEQLKDNNSENNKNRKRKVFVVWFCTVWTCCVSVTVKTVVLKQLSPQIISKILITGDCTIVTFI